MALTSTPEQLHCVADGQTIEATGYLPARTTDDGYVPVAERAVCGACGFNEVGMTGCAPTLEDLAAPDEADVLLHVKVTADGLAVISTKA